MKNRASAGFEYLIELVNKAGQVVDREVVHNLLPTEGLNHILSVALSQGTQVPTWYIGLFEGNYTPLPTDTAATFATNAVETTTYDEAARQAWVEGAIASGAVNNTDSRAEFTSNATKTIYGGFMASNSTKGATSGVLLSVVRFSSPKAFEAGFVLRVTAGFTMTSV